MRRVPAFGFRRRGRQRRLHVIGMAVRELEFGAREARAFHDIADEGGGPRRVHDGRTQQRLADRDLCRGRFTATRGPRTCGVRSLHPPEARHHPRRLRIGQRPPERGHPLPRGSGLAGRPVPLRLVVAKADHAAIAVDQLAAEQLVLPACFLDREADARITSCACRGGCAGGTAGRGRGRGCVRRKRGADAKQRGHDGSGQGERHAPFCARSAAGLDPGSEPEGPAEGGVLLRGTVIGKSLAQRGALSCGVHPLPCCARP
jgi:hypothetical protein